MWRVSQCGCVVFENCFNWESVSCWRLTLGRILYFSLPPDPSREMVILEDFSSGRHDGWFLVGGGSRAWNVLELLHGSCHFLDVTKTWLNGWMEWSWKYNRYSLAENTAASHPQLAQLELYVHTHLLKLMLFKKNVLCVYSSAVDTLFN